MYHFSVLNVFQNRVLVVAVVACIAAQVSKFLVDWLKNGKPNWHVLVETGGMPSSHSALVTSLAAGVGQTAGWSSMEFAIAAIFAAIVMYDATGIRRAAGKQAKILNQMIELFQQEEHEFSEDKLKELLGHTPFQVLVGSVLGLAVSWIAAPTY
ncbi:divergent PAP2 family protein [Geitlerinema sp. PCC 9228]|jgi:hypothetical protein|uniref:divergent PAP2 family protein n=1 Tax=Geitlerinema sp. PCC 9228 TaxID=111611 RepID=UPI0008F98BDF|nr:divergent PAP2 family protein [Geitlerinema sp. PCC 9228]